MMTVPSKQWRNWADRILQGEHIEEEMVNAGVLPHAGTPLPPTNASIHLLADEIGYGTPHRTFVGLCGVSWTARESTDEHKYVMQGDHYWHKHINCPKCRELMEQGNG